MTPVLVDRKAAAAALGVSLWTLDQFIADEQLPVVRLPSSRHIGERSRRVLIEVSALEAFIARHRSGSEA